VSFENVKPAQPQQPVQRQVTVSQVVTETNLVTGSLQLEQALNNNQHMEFCAMKAANATDTMQESIWNFLMVCTRLHNGFLLYKIFYLTT